MKKIIFLCITLLLLTSCTEDNSELMNYIDKNYKVETQEINKSGNELEVVLNNFHKINPNLSYAGGRGKVYEEDQYVISFFQLLTFDLKEREDIEYVSFKIKDDTFYYSDAEFKKVLKNGEIYLKDTYTFNLYQLNKPKKSSKKKKEDYLGEHPNDKLWEMVVDDLYEFYEGE